MLCSAEISTGSPAFHFIYCRPLAAKHGETLNAFADDTQLYLHCNSNSTASATSTLESCIVEVSHWVSANRLKLNKDKTELLWTGSDQSIRKLSGNRPTLTLVTDIINASVDACCLGVTITLDLRLAKHTSIVGGKCFCQLLHIRRVCRSFDMDTAATLIHAFVTSRIDYCNCLLANAPKLWTDKLQRISNAAARVLTEMNTYDPGLARILHSDLHWLGVPEEIK